MPKTARVLARTARSRARATNVPYTQARSEVVRIHELMEENEWTFAEAEEFFDDPANQLMCEVCGWSWGMVCPECAKGCGCSTGCTGWRHGEWTGPSDDDDPEDHEVDCPECGGSYDDRTGYGCACNPG